MKTEKEDFEKDLSRELNLIHDAVRNRDFDLGFRTGFLRNWNENRANAEKEGIEKFWKMKADPILHPKKKQP